ncbi:cytochrome P450 [Streptomyces sp. NPDC001852]|uniref:cytochrome P450 n=1 Tax=Streptomyces sp. NPDC001852 TaxID=3364619 RepID=UPI0036B9A5E8
MDRLRRDPELLPLAVEELLRNELPVHMRERIPHADIDVAGTKIPQHASVILVLASGNRDPMRFHEPDRFEPTRPDNQHLGFGSGIHLCYGGPGPDRGIHRAQRAASPPRQRPPGRGPPYRQNAMLRGPRPLSIQL